MSIKSCGRAGVALAALVFLVVAIAACGGSSGVSSSAGGESTAGGESGSDGETVAAGGESGGSVKVGAILSLSGTNSTLGPPEQHAMEMGLEALSEQGGFEVGGKKYTMEVTFADDKSDAATTGTTQFLQMTQSEDLPLIAIGLGSSSYGPVLQRDPVPTINILDSTYPSILSYDPHLFLLRSSSDLYVPGCLNYAKNQLGASSIGVISPQGEPYGEGLTQLVEKSAPGEGMQVSAVEEYPIGSSDFGNAITKVLASNPEAIYLSSVTAVQLPVLKQLRQAGYKGPVFHSSGVNPEQAKAILGSDYNTLMENNYDCAGTLPTTSSNPATLAFAKEYESRFNEYPQDLTMWAYDFPFVVAAAMSQAETTSEPEAIYEALQEIAPPKGTISGWIPGPSGSLFTERQAETLSEITQWCSDQKTIANAMVYQVKDGKTVDAKVEKNACAKVG